MKQSILTPRLAICLLVTMSMLVVNSCKKEETPPPIAKSANLIMPDKLMSLSPLSNSLFTSDELAVLRKFGELCYQADNDHSNPCHGTARLGNMYFQGTFEHWIIQLDYVFTSPSTRKREYYIPNSSGAGYFAGPGYADMVDLGTKEIFEIKSYNSVWEGGGWSGYQTAKDEVTRYVKMANQNCGGGWRPGASYTAKTFPVPFPYPHNIRVQYDMRGVNTGIITYMDAGGTSTVPVGYPIPGIDLANALKGFFRDLVISYDYAVTGSMYEINQRILLFIKQHPAVKNYLKAAGIAIIIATIAEDVASAGAGIADDWLTFLIARNMWVLSNAPNEAALVSLVSSL